MDGGRARHPQEWMGVNDHLREDKLAAGESVETLRMSATAQQHVDAYLEYDRIVGDADGGQLLSEADYASFRAKAAEERARRLYVSWRCIQTEVDCKQIGPSARCFCGHRYRGHLTDNLSGKQKHHKDVPCKEQGCRCARFNYLPSHGTWVIKCTCKHEAEDHCPKTKKCLKGCGCTSFYSSHRCACGASYEEHETVIETREERQSAGRPVDNLTGGGVGYEALGGLTDFSSLADGHERLAGTLPFTEHMGRLQLGQEAAVIGGAGERAALAGPAPSSSSRRDRGQLQDPGGDEFPGFPGLGGGGGGASSSSRSLGGGGGGSTSAAGGAGRRFCSECGAQAERDSAKFCGDCGTKLG